MCCRYLIFRNQLKELMRQVGLKARAEFETRYNIAPGTKIFAVRDEPDGPAPADLHWGLIPSWSRSRGLGTGFVNAQAETLSSKPSFREAFKRRRCLVPASGFYEWKKEGRARLPWLFRLRGEEPFFMAAIWEPAVTDGEDSHDSCAVITTEPNELMRPIHHRMPVIFETQAAVRWMNSQASGDELQALLRPFPAEQMLAQALDTRVNSVAHDDAECLRPAMPGAREEQGMLGF